MVRVFVHVLFSLPGDNRKPLQQCTKGGFQKSKPWLAPGEIAPATGRFRPGSIVPSSQCTLQKISVSVLAGAQSSAKSSWIVISTVVSTLSWELLSEPFSLA